MIYCKSLNYEFLKKKIWTKQEWLCQNQPSHIWACLWSNQNPNHKFVYFFTKFKIISELLRNRRKQSIQNHQSVLKNQFLCSFVTLQRQWHWSRLSQASHRKLWFSSVCSNGASSKDHQQLNRWLAPSQRLGPFNVAWATLCPAISFST